MLPYAGAGAGLAAAGAGEVGATAAEIVVVHEVAQPEPAAAAAAAAAPHGGACPPDLSVVAKVSKRPVSVLYTPPIDVATTRASSSSASDIQVCSVHAKCQMLEGLRRRSNPYTADELKRTTALPTPVWLQFLQPYLRKPHAA